MADTQIKNGEITIQKPRKYFLIAQILLRTMTAAVALAATVIMVNNKQTISLFGLQISAKYSYSPAFRFFVVTNALAAAYSVMSLPFVFLLNSPSSDPRSHFSMFLLDMIMMELVMAGSSAATAIAYVGLNGNQHIGWAAICDKFGRFCDYVIAALACSYAALILLFLLFLLSANRSRQTNMVASF